MILAVALLFIAMLSALTVYVAVTSGITFLTLVALIVLGMFASGIVGALRHRPPDD